MRDTRPPHFSALSESTKTELGSGGVWAIRFPVRFPLYLQNVCARVVGRCVHNNIFNAVLEIIKKTPSRCRGRSPETACSGCGGLMECNENGRVRSSVSLVPGPGGRVWRRNKRSEVKKTADVPIYSIRFYCRRVHYTLLYEESHLLTLSKCFPFSFFPPESREFI